jgi:hypothetical protein
MNSFTRNSLAFLTAALTTYFLAAVAATQSVMNRLADMGVEVPFNDRMATTFADLAGMFGTFMPLLLIALALGFVIAALISRFRPGWKSFGYPLAGFAAVITMHLLMHAVLEITPVAATRSVAGLLVQGLAGAAGGWVFYFLSIRSASRKSGGAASHG